jgi:hypothetical protein
MDRFDLLPPGTPFADIIGRISRPKRKERDLVRSQLGQYGITAAEIHAKATELNSEPLRMFEGTPKRQKEHRPENRGWTIDVQPQRVPLWIVAALDVRCGGIGQGRSMLQMLVPDPADEGRLLAATEMVQAELVLIRDWPRSVFRWPCNPYS